LVNQNRRTINQLKLLTNNNAKFLFQKKWEKITERELVNQGSLGKWHSIETGREVTTRIYPYKYSHNSHTVKMVGNSFIAECRLPESVVMWVGWPNHILQLLNSIFSEQSRNAARTIVVSYALKPP